MDAGVLLGLTLAVPLAMLAGVSVTAFAGTHAGVSGVRAGAGGRGGVARVRRYELWSCPARSSA